MTASHLSRRFAPCLVVLVALASCSQDRPVPPCSMAAVDPGQPIDVGTGMAAQVWASETAPFDPAHPDPAWFECPHAIAHAFERRPDVPITAPQDGAPTTITVDPTIAYQTILGIGTSMEESSVANILALPPGKRDELLVRLFDRDRGMGLSLVRVTIGTSDFTGTPWYTYEDDPSAPLSIQRDFDLGIIGVLRRIRAIAPDVVFFASPWSPPPWMKTSGQVAGGQLVSAWIPRYAAYLRQFVQAYGDAGIPIYALTLQNEPRHDWDLMPTCFVTSEQEAALAIALKSELAGAGLKTKLWIYDHNFDKALDYATDALSIPGALDATDGVAFHDYAGDPSAMSDVRARFPDKDMVFTEKMLWGVWGVDRAAQYFRNGSTSYVSWSTVLDQHNAPNNSPNSAKPRRFVRNVGSSAWSPDGYYATPEHYLLGLYSKLVRPGARRIASDYGDPSRVTDVAFANPDGTIAVVVINQTEGTQGFALRFGDRQTTTSLDAKTAAGILFHP
jgi:glucosylceramidase